MKTQPIILVNPGGRPQLEALDKDRDAGIYMYPYSLLFLQNYLLKKDIDSHIIDLYWQSVDELLETVKKHNDIIVGVTAQSHSFRYALSVIEKVKAINNNATIIVGGSFFTNTHEDLLNRYSCIDFVVRGEGEITLYELIKAIFNQTSFAEIEGISYQENGRTIINNDRKPELNIDQFSLDYDKLPMVDRFNEGILMRNFEKENYRCYPVFLGRGCSRRCAFCEYNLFRYRIRKINEILKEIDYFVENHNAEYLFFSDPSFCERKNFVVEFCNELIEKYPALKWACEARIDTPDEVLELMAKAGCISIDFGLESGSEKVLKSTYKDIDLNNTDRFVKKCNSLGIRSHMFLLVSLPDETEEDAMQTVEMSKRLSKYVTSMSLGVTQILPGTKLERIAFEKGILPKDFSYYEPAFYHSHTQFCDAHVPLYLEHLSIDFIEKVFTKIMDIKAQKYDNFSTLLRKAKTGILTVHQRPLKKNMIYIRRFITAFFNKV